MKKIVLRDRYGVEFGSFQYDPSRPSTYIARGKLAQDTLDFTIPVSYTHLTLPTKA